LQDLGEALIAVDGTNWWRRATFGQRQHGWVTLRGWDVTSGTALSTLRTDVVSHGLRIEQARPADLDQLTALDARTFSRFDRYPRGDWAALLEESLAGGPARILVARYADHASGAVVVVPDLTAKEVTIVSLAVDGPYRRTGLATRLLCDVLSTMAEQIQNVTLEVRIENSAARFLYEKLGFQITRTIRGYYGDGGTALEYSAPLALVLTRTCPRQKSGLPKLHSST
jgi:ribosomal protein S18 acetylase RimI-like enzyme